MKNYLINSIVSFNSFLVSLLDGDLEAPKAPRPAKPKGVPYSVMGEIEGYIA